MQTLFRLPQVCALTGLSRSSIYVLVAKGEFPAPVRITKRAIAWPSASVEAWIRQKTEGVRHDRGETAGAA